MLRKTVIGCIIFALFVGSIEPSYANNKIENASNLSDFGFKELIDSLLPPMIKWRADELQEYRTQLSSIEYACLALYYAENHSNRFQVEESQISLRCDSILHATMFFVAGHKLWREKTVSYIIHQYAERLYENGYNPLSAFWANIGVMLCLNNNEGGSIYGELRSLESALEVDSLPKRSIKTQLAMLKGFKRNYASEANEHNHSLLVKHYTRAAELALMAGYFSIADSIKEEALDFLWDRKNPEIINGEASVVRPTAQNMFQIKAIESELYLCSGDTIKAIEKNESLLWRYYENAVLGQLKQEHYPYYFKAIKFLSRQNRFDDSSYEHLIYASKYIRDYMLTICPLLSPLMQENFYVDARQTIELINSQLIKFIDKEDVNKTIYNNLLLFKGLELHTAKALNNYNFSFANKDIQNNYDDLLLSLVRFQYKEVTTQAKILNTSNFKNILDVDYDSISSSLDTNSIAIEFFGDKYSDRYYACICSNGWDEPIVVPLLLLNELEDAYAAKKGYITKKMFSKIWQPIVDLVPNSIERIYFAPDGLLHAMAIEYLPDLYHDDFENINDAYELYRVSSTKEVVNSNKNALRKDKSVLLIGDIDYGNNIADDKERGIFNDFNDSSRISRLVASTVEISELTSLFHNSGWKVNRLTGRNVSKDTFLNYSAQYSIEHISTHGFFIDDNLISQQVSEKFSFLNGPLKYGRDASLLRSGFVVSSANNFYSNGDESGIITAADIANTNRKHVDLVVISACQSGQGVITGDGIHGLQRGYKIAGANAIIVALWDIDDWVAEFFIKEFYTHYLSGCSKRDSLRKAQKSVRLYNGLMPDNQPRNLELPKYWAPFILLDGIN